MAKKLLYTRSLGAIVAKEAHPLSLGKYHVISGEAKQWTVVPDGKVRPLKAFPNRQEAITFARKTASKWNGIVIIHGESGLVTEMVSFN